MNGVATVGVAGLMGALGAGSALGMGGIVGALNGVIQTPAGTSSPHTHATGAAAGVTLPVSNRYGWSMPSFYSSSFNPRLRTDTRGKYRTLPATSLSFTSCLSVNFIASFSSLFPCACVLDLAAQQPVRTGEICVSITCLSFVLRV